MDTIELTDAPRFLKRPTEPAPKRPTPTGLSASAISPLLADFLSKIEPHLPADLPEADSDELNDLVSILFEEHVEPLEYLDVTPASAYVALNGLLLGSRCRALDPVSEAMICSAADKLASLIARQTAIRSKADALARIDFITYQLEEFTSGCEVIAAKAALEQLRWDTMQLIEDGAQHDSTIRLRPFDDSPLVCEVEAVEKAFGAIGRTPEEAHAAMGYFPNDGEACAL